MVADDEWSAPRSRDPPLPSTNLRLEQINTQTHTHPPSAALGFPALVLHNRGIYTCNTSLGKYTSLKLKKGANKSALSIFHN